MLYSGDSDDNVLDVLAEQDTLDRYADGDMTGEGSQADMRQEQAATGAVEARRAIWPFNSG